MFAKALSRDAKASLALLGRSRWFPSAYLAGGTACALHLGHRVSVDFDFFTPEAFETSQILKSLKQIGAFKLEEQSQGTLLGTFEKIRFSLFTYPYPVLFPLTAYLEVPILDLRDIAAMKIAAIGSRGIKRDFIDLYFICRSGISVKKVLSLYQRKFSGSASQQIHLQKSLIYFADAEMGKMPKMLVDLEWEQVKRYFEDQIKKLNAGGAGEKWKNS